MAKDVGILFADISGSTRLYRTLGTDEAKHQLERCVKRMERSIASGKGTLVMPAVDELVATFPTADDLIHAAIDMRRRIADLPPVSGIRLSIRIGVHYGSLSEDKDGFSGSAVDIGKSLLNLAGVGQIVTCDQTAASLTKSQRETLLPIADMVMSTSLGDCQVFEVREPAGFSATPSAAGTLTGVSSTATASSFQHMSERLFVRINGAAYVIDNAAPRMTFGRDKESSYVLHGPKASRHHAVIEKRGRAGFVLLDQSTNGSYLKIDGNKELHLTQGEAIITGGGKIGFGHSVDVAGDVVDIEIS